MKKIKRKFRIIDIDVFIYRMTKYVEFNLPDFKYSIEKTEKAEKIRYHINDYDRLVHESYLYSKVFLLKSIKKRGPVIGDCVTKNDYRGQSIYPYVINKIAKETLENENEEVYVIVNKDNINSIKGIEKARFEKFASIKAKRWLWFYLRRQVKYYE